MTEAVAPAATRVVDGKRGPGRPAGSGSGETARNKLVTFDTSTAVDANGVTIPLSEKGLLTAVPTNFKYGTHKPLTMAQFEMTATYLESRVMVETAKAAALQEKMAKAQHIIAKLTKRASVLRTFKSDEQRRKALKAQTLIAQYNEVMAQLKADGVTAEQLDDIGTSDKE